MTDPKSVATRYLDAWNEVDADRRARLLREHWVDDARYVDPLMRGDGVQQIDAHQRRRRPRRPRALLVVARPCGRRSADRRQ